MRSFLSKTIRFVPLVPNKDHLKENNKSMETTVVFLISIFQYVNLAFVYSKGPPYRKNILTNRNYLSILFWNRLKLKFLKFF
jgi:magnesium-transporting ATPase (P-type)